MAGQFHHGGAAEFGADYFQQQTEEPGARLLREGATVAEIDGNAEIGEYIAQDRIILLAAAAQNRNVVVRAAFGADKPERFAKRFLHLAGFARARENRRRS